jgi:hypothetical protein
LRIADALPTAAGETGLAGDALTTGRSASAVAGRLTDAVDVATTGGARLRRADAFALCAAFLRHLAGGASAAADATVVSVRIDARAIGAASSAARASAAAGAVRTSLSRRTFATRVAARAARIGVLIGERDAGVLVTTSGGAGRRGALANAGATACLPVGTAATRGAGGAAFSRALSRVGDTCAVGIAAARRA